MLGLQRVLVATLCVLVGLVVFTTFQVLGRQDVCTAETSADPVHQPLTRAEPVHAVVRPR